MCTHNKPACPLVASAKITDHKRFGDEIVKAKGIFIRLVEEPYESEYTSHCGIKVA